MRVRVRVPGSTSNLGPGFDCLGLALELPLEVEVETRPEGLEIGLSGPESKGIARDSENLIHASLQRVLRRSGRTEFGLHLRIDNSIPVSRGLGSSGAATVAGVLAGHLLA
ncbi:MAG: homoserine kinase, partial [Candidatus Krumholzibacteriia bacterium]